MDDYLDEKEQIEEIKSWLKENWLALVAGVIVGFGGLFFLELVPRFRL